VGEVDLFELLLAFMNSEGNLAFGRAWHFFLKVEDGDETRVNPLRLAALLASSGSNHSESSEWVTYGGVFGLACLMISFIYPGDLPPSLHRYELAQSCLFPHLHDVKMLAECDPGHEVTGDLRDTASQLGVTADVCDVVTVLRCFYSMKDKVNIYKDDQS
jgi:hypothetical protein